MAVLWTFAPSGRELIPLRSATLCGRLDALQHAHRCQYIAVVLCEKSTTSAPTLASNGAPRTHKTVN